MRRIQILASIIVFVLGIELSCGLASENKTESSLAKEHLENLNLLINLSRTGKSTLQAAEGNLENYQERAITEEITDKTGVYHAFIYGLDTAIPDFLTNNCDRIFRMIATYLDLKNINDKIVVWVMDSKTLQEIPFGPESCFKGCPRTLSALYAPAFNYVLFTPEYMNDYYVTHEFIHYYIDEYEEEVAAGLPEIVKQRNVSSLPPQKYLKQNEEVITIELSRFIISWSEHSFLYGKT